MEDNHYYHTSLHDELVWEPHFFSKIPSTNSNIEKGNRLQVATEIALKQGKWDYEDLTQWFHKGNIADYETPQLLIECKNWFTDYYRITIEKVRTQILPRFVLADDKMKVLIISESKWDSAALRLVRQNNIQIIEVPRVESDVDILWVTKRIREGLIRVCRIDDYCIGKGYNDIRDTSKSLRYRILNRISNMFRRVLRVSEAKTTNKLASKTLSRHGHCLDRRFVQLDSRLVVYSFICPHKLGNLIVSSFR